MTDVSTVLALLYAGPGAAICRGADGALEVAPQHRAEDVVLTQDEVLQEGVETLLALALAHPN